MQSYTPRQSGQLHNDIPSVPGHAQSVFTGMQPVIVPYRWGLCITLMLGVNTGTLWYRWRSLLEYVEAAGWWPPFILFGLIMVYASLSVRTLRVAIIVGLGYRITHSVPLAGVTYSRVEPAMSPNHQVVLFLAPAVLLCVSGLWFLHWRPAPWIVFTGYALLMSACSFCISDLSKILELRHIRSRLQGPPWPHIAWIHQEHYHTLKRQGQLP